MEGGAHPSPFAALSFPDLKRVSIYCWVNRKSFPVVEWRRPALNSQPFGDFLYHNQAVLTTRLRHTPLIPLKVPKNQREEFTSKTVQKG